LAEKHCTLPLCLILAEETHHGFSLLPDRCFYYIISYDNHTHIPSPYIVQRCLISQSPPAQDSRGQHAQGAATTSNPGQPEEGKVWESCTGLDDLAQL